jgi:hypothetical protein
MRTKILRFLVITAVILVLLCAAWLWFSLQWSYSKGERAGYVQKLSEKGWICKTWEGEIAMVTMPGAIPEKFEFTVRGDDVAQKINILAGKRVVLHYRQYKYIPSSCFGDTEYFVDDVREVVDTPAPAASPAAAAVPAPAATSSSIPPAQLQTPR